MPWGALALGWRKIMLCRFYGTIAKVSHMESYLIVAMGVWSNLGRAPPIWLLTHLKHSWDASGSVSWSQACVLNQLTLALVSETPHSMTQDVGIV